MAGDAVEQFDLVEALERRDDGIRQVAENNERFLRVARELAQQIAKHKRGITCDDVRAVCPLDPLHSNAWGALFKAKGWQWTGEYRRSALIQGHGNLQRVWRYIGEDGNG